MARRPSTCFGLRPRPHASERVEQPCIQWCAAQPAGWRKAAVQAEVLALAPAGFDAVAVDAHGGGAKEALALRGLVVCDAVQRDLVGACRRPRTSSPRWGSSVS